MRPEHPHPVCRLCLGRHWLRPLRRRWPLLFLVALILVLLVTRFVEIRQLAATLAQGHWQWLLAALLLQGVYYLLYALLFKAGFAMVGVSSRVRELIPVLFVSILVGTVAPVAGISAAAVLIEDAARRDQSAARAAEGVLLVWVAGLGAMVPLLLIGLGHLQWAQALQIYELVGALLFILYIGGMTAALLMAMWQPGRLRHLFRLLQRTANRILARLRRPLLSEDWATRNARECTGAAMAIATHPRQIGNTLGVALGIHLLNLASLWAVFLAFDQTPAFGALTAGFSLGYVFSIISILPLDLGVVEGVMTLVYSSLGVPVPSALVISLAFRGLNVWLPIVLSFFSLRLVQAFRGRKTR